MTPIVIPNKLKECNVAQLMGYGIYMDVIHKYEQNPDDKGTKEDEETLEVALGAITQEHRNFITGLSQEQRVNLSSRVTKAGISIAKEIGAITPVIAPLSQKPSYEFKIPKLEYFELLETEEKAKGLFSWSAKYKALKKDQQTKVIIRNDLHKEPAHIWTMLLDGIARSIAQNGAHIWRNWQYLPDVLAAISWEKGQSRFTKKPNGDLVVNWDLINKRSSLMLGMSAESAIKAFNFFLTTPMIISKFQSFALSSRHPKVKTSRPAMKGEPLVKNTDG